MTKEQFSELAAVHADTIFRIAFHYSKNAADADDIVQNVLLKLYRTDKIFESDEHIRNWLIRVAVNESKKLLLSPWFQRTAPIEEYTQQLDFTEPGQSELFQAVMALPKKYRIPIYLYYYEDYSVKEIAEICGRRESTIQTQLMRARKKLKENLQEDWSNE
jgi:RNA polymerase sigma factor (sigma-70 family)